MVRPFTQTADHHISCTSRSDFFRKLPEVIQQHTGWDYSYQETDTGCFLKPTFHRMPYRNSFVPEIDIVVSGHDDQTILHMTGQPVKPVRIFMALWFGFLLAMGVLLLSLAVTSELASPFPLLIAVAMCAFGFLLCKIAVRAAFHSVVKAIQEEFS